MPVRIVAHRGIHHGLPENSREAIWRALDDQFWVELDVHAAADGVPIVLHDDTLDRTTNATGPVWAKTSAELKRVGLRGGGLVPTLEDCLARKIDKQVGWLIEIKPPGARELVRRTFELAWDRLGYFVLQSFDLDNVRYAQELCRDEAPVSLLVGDQQELEAALAGDWYHVNVDHRLLTPDVMKRFWDKGAFDIGAWTVNEREDIQRVIDLGIGTIISDNPWRVREMVYYLTPDEWRNRLSRGIDDDAAGVT
jgi:glycerophosphoryl diester phosphodiesterase